MDASDMQQWRCGREILNTQAFFEEREKQKDKQVRAIL